MDKTTLANATTLGVYRKYETDSAKQQSDSSLCDDIYNNMRMLAYFYPFSDGLKENFEIGMFLKSNTKAFPHVMKYLFTILDPNEFKKKFCWPLYNKAAEATFRNSSLEFLIKLDAKHKLNFGELKNKIVVFPGGSDFMRIVVEVTKLAMRVILKRNGVDPSQTDQMALTNAEAHAKLQQTQMLYEHVRTYTAKLNTQAAELKEKTTRIRKFMEELTEGTSISTTDILHGGFCANWQATQNHIVENGVQPQLQRFEAFRNKCECLERKINAVVMKQPIKYDTESFNSFINGMRRLFPMHSNQLSNCANQHNINMNNLLIAFRLALPLMLNDAEAHKPLSSDVVGYEARGVENMAVQVNNIVHKTAMFETQINQIVSNTNGGPANEKLISVKNANNMKSMIFATPAIPLAAIKRREQSSKRISLMKESFPIRKASTFNGTLRPIRSMPIEEVPNTNGKTFTSPIRGRCLTTSKYNPMQLLRTIEKNNKFCQPNRPKRIESPKFTLPLSASIDPNGSIAESSSMSLINQSDTDNNNQTTIFASSPKQFHSSFDAHSPLSPYQSALRKRPLFDDEQSRQRSDINRSPSGRLETRVGENKVDAPNNSVNISKEITAKKLQLSPINLPSSTHISFNKPMGIIPIAATINHSNIENNPNAHNTNKFTLFHLINENEESLLNISDSVLASANDCSRIE